MLHVQLYELIYTLFSPLQSLTHARKKIVFYSCGDKKKQANAAYLIGSYAVSVLIGMHLCSLYKMEETDPIKDAHVFGVNTWSYFVQ